ncbi:hypothetical protein CPC16_008091 [Podila verticillata]|nr:hypothetical protein BGZ59_004857 [Podila verticillata]KAF9385128.1 hypothetical protein CPC16_008091 [Podila verticillata]KFH63552.1 hypothetical protein MVEG_10961 [Podila verticillata NRRL 6337]
MSKETAAPRRAGIRITPGFVALHLLPAAAFALYVYSNQGPFQSTSCITFGRNCLPPSTYMQGTFEKAEFYGPVARYYNSLFLRHEDLGGSLAVFTDGVPVIDLYAGFKDLKGTQVYDNTTLQHVYSCGKAVEGIIIARLVQSGFLNYDAKVTDYWPEFGQNGKEDIRLVDIMTHEAGVFFLDDDTKELSWNSLKDKEAFSARLAKQAHYFGKDHKGHKRAYHAITRGWYLNEIVRRVDPQGRTIGEIAKEELMVDYPDVELYYSHFPENNEWWESRLSPMVDYPLLRVIGRMIIPDWMRNHQRFGFPGLRPAHRLTFQVIKKDTPTAKGLSLSFVKRLADLRTKEAHATESPSFSLKSNAHSLAKLMSMMANKGSSIKPGQEPDLLSREVYEEATTFHSEHEDAVTLTSIPISRGGWIKSTHLHNIESLKGVEIQGWGGAGGSLIIWIEELGLGFSYVTNAFGAPEGVLGDIRGQTLLELVVRARKQELGLLPKPEPRKVEEKKAAEKITLFQKLGLRS